MLAIDDRIFSENVEVFYIPARSINGNLAISSPKIMPPTSVNSDRCPVLFFHGATVPTQFTSEYLIDGVSWMGELTKHRWNVFGLDLPGYGRSDNYTLDSSGELDPRKFGSSACIQEDIDEAVEWILEKTESEQVHIIAISRGAIPAGHYCASHPEKIKSLTLHAPITAKDGIDPAILMELLGSEDIPKQATFTLSASDRFRMLEEDRPKGTTSDLEPSFVENWVEDYGKTLAQKTNEDNGNPTTSPIPTPIGFVVDIYDAWHGSYFDPAKIESPFLLLRGDWDKFLTPARETQELFEAVSSTEKFYIQLPRATHSILYEQGRHEMYRTVENFMSKYDATEEKTHV